MRLTQLSTLIASAALCLTLSACGFQLRESTQLPTQFQSIGLKSDSQGQALRVNKGFGRILHDAFVDADSKLSIDSDLTTQLVIRNLDEDRRVASYDANLDVRQYLIYLLFDYDIVVDGKTLATQRIRLDQTMNYDSDFVLGKQQEELQIRDMLRKEAARLILLRLKSIAP